VGSVDRSADFGRDFRPRRGLSRSRLASLRSAIRDGAMPAISVFEVGGAYFVEDGHHRVALARERRAEYIDAEVTRLQTNYEVDPDVDVCRLVHTEQQRAPGGERAEPRTSGRRQSHDALNLLASWPATLEEEERARATDGA
jgi:hypothetical protein